VQPVGITAVPAGAVKVPVLLPVRFPDMDPFDAMVPVPVSEYPGFPEVYVVVKVTFTPLTSPPMFSVTVWASSAPVPEKLPSQSAVTVYVCG
jgi:hypothetical protein